MMSVIPLAEFILMLPKIAHDVKASERLIIERGAKMIQKKAKATIGRSNENWPPLAASTIADKAKHGYKTPAPLLRTGALRDSIEYTVVSDHEAWIGTDHPVAAFQEFGTSRIPPRPFMASAAIASEDRIHRLAAAATIAALAGHGKGARELHELLHALRHVGHEIRNLVHDLLDDDEDEGKKR
jgi:HK97 gp10 family phage protein